jgi:hypothetical protein
MKLFSSLRRAVTPGLKEFEVVLRQADLSGTFDYYACIDCRRGTGHLVCGTVGNRLNGFVGIQEEDFAIHTSVKASGDSLVAIEGRPVLLGECPETAGGLGIRIVEGGNITALVDEITPTGFANEAYHAGTGATQSHLLEVHVGTIGEIG